MTREHFTNEINSMSCSELLDFCKCLPQAFFWVTDLVIPYDKLCYEICKDIKAAWGHLEWKDILEKLHCLRDYYEYYIKIDCLRYRGFSNHDLTNLKESIVECFDKYYKLD